MRFSDMQTKALIILMACVAALPSALAAQNSGDSTGHSLWTSAVDINFFLSTAYSYNFDRPDTLRNLYHVFDYTDNSLKVDVIELSLKKDAVNPSDAGFRVDLTAGSSIPRVAHSAGLEIGDLDIHQMYLSYVPPIGNWLKVDVGKFITPVGYEVIEGYDGYDDNYSRSFLFGYGIPYTHTGVRALFSPAEDFSGLAMVVNGWDNSIDSNRSKTLCGQLSLGPIQGIRMSAAILYGPEKPNNDAVTGRS